MPVSIPQPNYWTKNAVIQLSEVGQTLDLALEVLTQTMDGVYTFFERHAAGIPSYRLDSGAWKPIGVFTFLEIYKFILTRNTGITLEVGQGARPSTVILGGEPGPFNAAYFKRETMRLMYHGRLSQRAPRRRGRWKPSTTIQGVPDKPSGEPMNIRVLDNHQHKMEQRIRLEPDPRPPAPPDSGSNSPTFL